MSLNHLIVTRKTTMAEALQDILDHEFVIDVTFYKTENVYHGKAYTVGAETIESESPALHIMLFELYQKVDCLYNKEKN